MLSSRYGFECIQHDTNNDGRDGTARQCRQLLLDNRTSITWYDSPSMCFKSWNATQASSMASRTFAPTLSHPTSLTIVIPIIGRTHCALLQLCAACVTLHDSHPQPLPASPYGRKMRFLGIASQRRALRNKLGNNGNDEH